MNKVILIGRLVKDVELRYTQSGSAVASATVAVQRKFKNQAGEYESDFINIQAWNKTAEFLANYFKKGQQLAIEGRIQTGSYEKDGVRHYRTDVIVEQVEFVGSKQDSKKQDSEHMGQQIDFSADDLPFDL